MSSTAFSPSSTTPPTAANLSTDLHPPGEATSKVKPCCVCKDEKASRDECMLFSSSADPQEACASTVEKYRSCMKGFGFNIA
ncbi:cytochrome C oxidase copper chaperone-domain-containing protein [Usnea florida]